MLIFFASPSHWLRQHRCALSAIPPPSSSLRLVVLSRSLPLATAAWLVWHQCFLLTSPLWLAVIYLCRVHRAFMRSLSARTEDGDPSAVLDKQNVCMYSMDCDDPSFLVACIFHCSMKSFLWTPFPSRLPLCYFTKTRNHGSSPTSSGKKKEHVTGIVLFSNRDCYNTNSLPRIRLSYRPWTQQRLFGAKAFRGCVALTCLSLWPQWSRQRLLE